MRLAIVFENFGPYHQARIASAARHLEVLAIEVAGRSGAYDWVVEPHLGFATRRLFEGNASQVDPTALSDGLDKVLSDFRPDAVAVPGWSFLEALAPLRWCLGQGVPAIVMSESTEWDEPRKPWKEWVKRRIVGLFSAALVGGRPHADYIASLGMPCDRISLGYDAVDNEYFAKEVEKARNQSSVIRHQYGLPQNYFLASARFIDKKNLPRLMEAYSRYRKLITDHRSLNTPPPWDLVLLGDGPLRPELERQISVLGLQSSVMLPGFKQYLDLPTYYGLAKAFIHASTTEQWGLVVNEAMASGLPVLVSNRCGCAQDLVQDAVNGFTFDPWDVEQLAQLMLKLSTIHCPLSTMGRQSQRIIAEWGPDRFAAGLKNAAETALEIGSKKAIGIDRLLLRLLIRRPKRP